MKGAATTNKTPRRLLAAVGTWSTIEMHLRNPFVVAFWSMTFAGFGHILVDKYFRGFLLVVGEIFINRMAHINLAIFYTLSGQFELAKQALDIRWFILYNVIYGFSIWDSYRETIDINNVYVLAAREDAEIPEYKIAPIGISFLSRNIPWLVAAWSAVLPGAGQFLTQRMNRSIFLIAFWITTVYFSRFLPAVHYTLMGQFNDARSVIDWQWFLNIPSVYFFSMYDAYSGTVERNKLFEWEQSKYMRREYQYAAYEMPFGRKVTGNCMYVVAEFKYTVKLEQAVTALQMNGIPKDSILAVPLDKRREARTLFDSIQSSDGLSLLDLPFILAMVLTLLGSIFGFKLYLGPIWWGVFGALAGMLAGLGIKLLVNRSKTRRQNAESQGDISVIVQCTPDQMNMVKNILWDNAALGVGMLSLGEDA